MRAAATIKLNNGSKKKERKKKTLRLSNQIFR
jgi:hypothetical protein